MNLELNYPPLYIMDVTRPRGVGPVVTRSAIPRRLPETRCRLPNTRRWHIIAVHAHARPVVARSKTCSRPIPYPPSPNPKPVVARSRTCCRLLRTCRRLLPTSCRPNCDPIFNLHTYRHASFLLSYPSSPGYYPLSAEFTRHSKLRTRRRLPSPVVARCATHSCDPSRARPVPIPISTHMRTHFSALR